jgi:hypothetical protein
MGGMDAAELEVVEATRLAQAFHESYERLAPEFGYQTRAESAVPWAEVPEANRQLMIASAQAVLADLRDAGRVIVPFLDLEGSRAPQMTLPASDEPVVVMVMAEAKDLSLYPGGGAVRYRWVHEDDADEDGSDGRPA